MNTVQQYGYIAGYLYKQAELRNPTTEAVMPALMSAYLGAAVPMHFGASAPAVLGSSALAGTGMYALLHYLYSRENRLNQKPSTVSDEDMAAYYKTRRDAGETHALEVTPG